MSESNEERNQPDDPQPEPQKSQPEEPNQVPEREPDQPYSESEYDATDWDEEDHSQRRNVNVPYGDVPYDNAPHDDDDGEHHTEMGFFDHLEELRWRIIKSAIAVAVTSAFCGYFYQELVEDILFGPANRLTPPLKIINIEMAGQLTLTIQVVLFSGLILAIPIVIWQVWQFLKPGLYMKERRYVSAIAVATIFCFLTGVAFAYLIMIPNSIGFLAGFTYKGIENTITAANYLSFVLGFILACGVVFEMPMLSYALARFGILTPAFMRHYRRHAIVVILIIAAVVTPTPDPFNQMLLAIPLYGLYELSILVSAMASRHRAETIDSYANEEAEN